MATDVVKNCKGPSGFGACNRCYFEDLLQGKLPTDAAWDTLTCDSRLCRCEKSLLLFYCIFSYKLF